jgi:hypothetical protein
VNISRVIILLINASSIVLIITTIYVGLILQRFPPQEVLIDVLDKVFDV